MKKNDLLHPQIKDSPSMMTTFFDGCSNPEMEKNIGREIMFKKADCTQKKLAHTIVGIQRNYKMEIVYRVHETSRLKTDFGRCADPDEIVFINKGQGV